MEKIIINIHDFKRMITATKFAVHKSDVSFANILIHSGGGKHVDWVRAVATNNLDVLAACTIDVRHKQPFAFLIGPNYIKPLLYGLNAGIKRGDLNVEINIHAFDAVVTNNIVEIYVAGGSMWHHKAIICKIPQESDLFPNFVPLLSKEYGFDVTLSRKTLLMELKRIKAMGAEEMASVDLIICPADVGLGGDGYKLMNRADKADKFVVRFPMQRMIEILGVFKSSKISLFFDSVSDTTNPIAITGVDRDPGLKIILMPMRR